MPVVDDEESFQGFFRRHWGRNPYEETPEWVGYNPDAPRVEGYEGMQVRYVPNQTRMKGHAFHGLSDVWNWANKMGLLDDLRERFYAVYLDQQNNPLGYRLIGAGTVNECLVHPVIIWGPAMALQAPTVILIHNHPTGEVESSVADEKLTVRFMEIANLLGVRLLDHVIVGRKGARGLISREKFKPSGFPSHGLE